MRTNLLTSRLPEYTRLWRPLICCRSKSSVGGYMNFNRKSCKYHKTCGSNVNCSTCKGYEKKAVRDRERPDRWNGKINRGEER